MGRSPLEWILANGKAPTVLDLRKFVLRVEPLSAARTPLGNFLNSLLDRTPSSSPEQKDRYLVCFVCLLEKDQPNERTNQMNPFRFPREGGCEE
jgi:hypothetical protein